MYSKFIVLMASRNKKKSGVIATFSELYDKYWKVVTIFAVSVSASFWLGTYYEEVKKEREITVIENEHSMEILNQKEDYMNKYLDMREQLLINKNDTTHGNKKD